MTPRLLSRLVHIILCIIFASWRKNASSARKVHLDVFQPIIIFSKSIGVLQGLGRPMLHPGDAPRHVHYEGNSLNSQKRLFPHLLNGSARRVNSSLLYACTKVTPFGLPCQWFHNFRVLGDF